MVAIRTLLISREITAYILIIFERCWLVKTSHSVCRCSLKVLISNKTLYICFDQFIALILFGVPLPVFGPMSNYVTNLK